MTAPRDLRVPGDKSISHRALIFSALGTGTSTVRGILDAADVRSTASVLRTLGVNIPPLASEMRIEGVGLRGLRPPDADLDCGNSGTTTRLMAGVVAAQPFDARFIGDASLSRRPMHRVARPLEAMGAHVAFDNEDGLPMRIRGASLRTIEWVSETASAQVKSAILLAAVASGVRASVTEPTRSRDHTERMLAARGVTLTIGERDVSIEPVRRLMSADVRVPADPSSAAFFVALASCGGAPALRLPGVCLNDTRIGFVRLLQRMGAAITLEDVREAGGEPVGDILVGQAPLEAATVGADDVPAMIDEMPLLACVATRAEGETRITGAQELRGKESDRIRAVVENLRALGAVADELPDGMVVQGGAPRLSGEVKTHGDHRLAMAFAVLGALAGNDITIDEPSCVDVSYPEFWRHLEAARR